MNRTRGNRPGLSAMCAGILTASLGFSGAAAADSGEPHHAVPSISIFVNSGLNNPRGLRFGPDGYLYVAEGGIGGSNPACSVVPAVGPYTGSDTGGRISRIDRHGQRSTVTATLPSSQTSCPDQPGWHVGADCKPERVPAGQPGQESESGRL